MALDFHVSNHRWDDEPRHWLLVKGADVSTAMAGDSRRVDDLPKWVRRSWIIPLILGILMLILGLVLLFNIKAGIETLRWLVVFALIFAAVEAFATASLRQRPLGWLAGGICLRCWRNHQYRLAPFDTVRLW